MYTLRNVSEASFMTKHETMWKVKKCGIRRSKKSTKRERSLVCRARTNGTVTYIVLKYCNILSKVTK